MSRTDKILTPKYLDWHARLSVIITSISAKPQASNFKPITFEPKPYPELIIKSVLEHFTYLKFQNSFREIDNYNFALVQLWNSPCPICDRKHGNYGLHSEWYKNGMKYCFSCNSLSNKLKFAIVV